MPQKKKNQHYVFRGYLRPWSQDGRIYCLRAGKVIHANLRSVAFERFFYKVEELTPQERELIDRTVVQGLPEPFKGHLRRFLTVYSAAPKAKRQSVGKPDSASVEVLDELTVNLRSSFIRCLHAKP